MEEVLRLIRGSYGSADNKFAGHSLDRKRAAQSITAANDAEIGFEEFVEMHRTYLTQKGCTPAAIEAEIVKVKDVTRYFGTD